MDQVNSGSTKAQAIFDEATLYPNPYMVVTLVYFLDDIYNTYYCDDAQHWYRLERVAIAKLKKKMHFS